MNFLIISVYILSLYLTMYGQVIVVTSLADYSIRELSNSDTIIHLKDSWQIYSTNHEHLTTSSFFQSWQIHA